MALTVCTAQLSMKTKGYTDIINITQGVQKFVEENNLTEGQILIFINGATAAISTVEYEPGLLQDIPETLKAIYCEPTGPWQENNIEMHNIINEIVNGQ